jgi:hypothetical protein
LQTNNPYFKAKFKGLFKRQTFNSAGIYVFSNIQWTYLNITECNKIEKFDPYKQKTGDYLYKDKIAGSGFNWFRPKVDIIIPKSIEESYHGSLYNVIINDKNNNWSLFLPRFVELRHDKDQADDLKEKCK